MNKINTQLMIFKSKNTTKTFIKYILSLNISSKN
jgi:hypothetical protein